MANVYVNNAQNRKLGRVGMPRGSMPVSVDGTYSPAKTYVDNPFNRRHDRVGLRHGSMVVPKENDFAYRLGRKYNDSGIDVSRIFNDSGIDVSHTLNDSGIDVSHHSPDTYYSIIESSTNLHLKSAGNENCTNWRSTVKYDTDRQHNTQREDLHRYIRQQELQKYLLQQEQQTRKLKQLRQQEQQLQKQQQLLQEQQQLLQEQQRMQMQQQLQEQHTQRLIKVQEQQLQQLRQQEQQLLEKQQLGQLQQRLQEQQLLQEQQRQQLIEIHEQQLRQLQQLRQQEQQLQQQEQLLQVQKLLEEQQLQQVQQEQQLLQRQQLEQKGQLLQEKQLLEVQQKQQLRQIKQQIRQEHEQQKHLEQQEQQRIQKQQTRKLKKLRQQEQQKHLEQQTQQLKQLRQQEQQLQKQQQLLQEQQRMQIQQHLQELYTRQLIKVQEQQLQQLQQLRQQEQQIIEKQQLGQLQQRLQEQQLLQEQQRQQLIKLQEQQLRQLRQVRQQEQQLQQHLQQQEQLLQEQKLLEEQQLQQVQQEQQLLQQQQLEQQGQLLQEKQLLEVQELQQKQQLRQLQQLKQQILQEHEQQEQLHEVNCPDIWSTINHDQVSDGKTEIVGRPPEMQVHVQTFNNFSQRDSLIVQNIGPGVNNAASVPEDDDNDGVTLDLYQRESDKGGLLYNDSGIDTSMYSQFDSTIVTKCNPVRRRKECNVNYSSSPSYQRPGQIHKKSDIDCKIPNMYSGAIGGSKQKHGKSKDKNMKNSNPSLGFPDEDMDVEILYGTHLEDNETDFDGFEFIHKISEGWFSELHKAKWKNTVVAVKQINFQRATEQQLKDFKEEILLFRTLNHPNIVKCIASFTAKPNLCIVMEYMQICLYKALYTKDHIKFLESGKIKIIQDIALGLAYLHNSNIAHCNIMSKNIILNDIHSQVPVAKITDFSLSMKDEIRTSPKRNTRIPRYSAPEVLRGDILDVTYEKMADTYSYALVVFEIICEEEPFHTLDYPQLKRQVCELGLTPIKNSDIDLDSTVLRLLQKCWDREPWLRPTAKQITQYTLRMDRLILPCFSRTQESFEYLLCVGFILFFISILFISFYVVFQ